MKGLVPCYREYVDNPTTVPHLLDTTVIQGVLNTIPISSCEAERGFSQMNLVCRKQRASLEVDNISSLLFISINGPPPDLWEARSSVKKWFLQHRSAADTQSKVVANISVDDLNRVQRFFIKI